jgi:hypothetical protein
VSLHLKSAVVHLEVVSIVEIQRKRFVDSDRCKVTRGAVLGVCSDRL